MEATRRELGERQCPRASARQGCSLVGGGRQKHDVCDPGEVNERGGKCKSENRMSSQMCTWQGQ